MMRMMKISVAALMLASAGVAQAEDLPTKVGACGESTIKLIGGRLEGDTTFESGTAVMFDNGGAQITYDREQNIVDSRVGDPVTICLVSIPEDCPPGDERGKVYFTTNMRTGLTWNYPTAAICAAAPEAKMQIMCLNGWGGKLNDALAPYIAAVQPDVLCLQEVVHTPDAPKDWLTYRDGAHELPQRANFFADIASALPDHVAIFCPAAQGDLWDGDVSYDSQWGLASFVHKSLPIVAQAQGFAHGSFSYDGYGEHPRSRTAHVFRVHDFARGCAITIGHMHGLRDPLAGKQDTPERLLQAQRFKAMVETVVEKDDHVIVCGDFNVLPESQTFDVLGEIGLTDLVTTRGFSSTRTSHYTKPGRFADYMLVNAGLLDAPFDVITQPEVSDHCPLLLDIN